MATVPQADQGSARQRVRDQIQQAILAGEFPPGSRLPQLQLARRFEVAQSVIRESLLELQFCGLVEVVDNMGVFVSLPAPEKLLDAYEIREMFEGLAARLCCQRASRADIARLRDTAELVYRKGLDGQRGEMGALDRHFHQAMITIAGNEVLQRLTEGYRLLGMAVRADRDIEQIHTEHQAVVAAIEENRPDDAERLARGHVQSARAALHGKITSGSFEPKWVTDESA